jgi:multiple sugar transport system ATP-binding protein
LTSLQVKNLSKEYGNVRALNDFSLQVNSGEFTVLLGPSGCGKTTVVRCIAGLSNPTSGQIYIGDQMVNELPPKNRDIAMVFQNYALYPHMTIFENIAFPLKMRKYNKKEIETKVRQIADLLGLTSLLDRKPKELSGGQMQRVALGRALVREPKVFLMDEPLSNLDAKLRLQMRTEIKKLQRSVGITTLYITHDQVEAMSMADKIVVMDGGIIKQIGTPEQIYSEPADVFVAGFVGSPAMNFIDCIGTRKDSTIHLKSETGINMDLPADVIPDIKSVPEKITLGIRPRDIIMLKDKDNFKGCVMKGTISFIESLGDDLIIEIRLGKATGENTNTLNTGALIKIAGSNHISKFDDMPDIGNTVTFGIEYNKLHIFNAQNGQRL